MGAAGPGSAKEGAALVTTLAVAGSAADGAKGALTAGAGSPARGMAAAWSPSLVTGPRWAVAAVPDRAPPASDRAPAWDRCCASARPPNARPRPASERQPVSARPRRGLPGRRPGAAPPARHTGPGAGPSHISRELEHEAGFASRLLDLEHLHGLHGRGESPDGRQIGPPFEPAAGTEAPAQLGAGEGHPDGVAGTRNGHTPVPSRVVEANSEPALVGHEGDALDAAETGAGGPTVPAARATASSVLKPPLPSSRPGIGMLRRAHRPLPVRETDARRMSSHSPSHPFIKKTL